MASSSSYICFVCKEFYEDDKLSKIEDKGKEGFELLIKNTGGSALLSKWNDVKNTVVRYHQTARQSEEMRKGRSKPEKNVVIVVDKENLSFIKANVSVVIKK